MRKNIFLTSLFILSAILLSADPPEGYYDSAEGLAGDSLKAALHEIIDDHIEFPYTSSGTDTWDILKECDQDPENPENVILFYTGWSVNGDQEYNGGSGWSREHVWAKSHGDFGTSQGSGTDAHNLHACDISVNSARSNLDFDTGGSQYIDGDGETFNYSDTDSWEPWDEMKGDVARTIFYMATRYEGDSGELDLEVNDNVNNSPAPLHGRLSALYQWNLDDPPDAFEMNRNDVIYEDFQGNRNPFIDHPEYVTYIWGDEVPEDNNPPEIDSVYTISATNVIVDFTEWVDPTTAGLASNYSIDNGIGTPANAVHSYESDNSQVQLTVPELSTGIIYTLTVNNVEDLNDNVISPASTYQFELSTIVTLLASSFEQDLDGWTVYNAASNLDWERLSSTSWSHPSSVPHGLYYMHTNNYGADVPGDDWLISPQLNMAALAAPELSFYSWTQFYDDITGLEVLYSLNYNGVSDPGNSTWITIPAQLADEGSVVWFLEAGEDLSIIAGESNVYLAFHYESTGTADETCRAWAVDNVILTAEPETEPQLPIPQNVQISFSGNTLTLSWDPVTGADSYIIYAADDPNTAEAEWLLIGNVTNLSYEITSPATRKKFYRITAN